MVRELFRDQGATEFIIATIPTVLGVNESARLLQALRRERIPCKRIIVNQARPCLVSGVTAYPGLRLRCVCYPVCHAAVPALLRAAVQHRAASVPL